LKIVGFFRRFEIVRTEKHQLRAKPFRAYQDPSRISRYSTSWKQILAFFVRTQSNLAANSTFPKYRFTKSQKFLYRRLIRLISELDFDEYQAENKISSLSDDEEIDASLIESSEDEEEEEKEEDLVIRHKSIFLETDNRLNRVEQALLDFIISLLDHSSQQDEYELPLVNALAVLGLEPKGFRGPETYTSILSSILKLSRFFVLKFAFKDDILDITSSGESSDESDDIIGPENPFPGPEPDISKPLSRLKTLVDRFLIRGTHTPINWLLDLRSYGIKIAWSTTSSGLID